MIKPVSANYNKNADFSSLFYKIAEMTPGASNYKVIVSEVLEPSLLLKQFNLSGQFVIPFVDKQTGDKSFVIDERLSSPGRTGEIFAQSYFKNAPVYVIGKHFFAGFPYTAIVIKKGLLKDGILPASLPCLDVMRLMYNRLLYIEWELLERVKELGSIFDGLLEGKGFFRFLRGGYFFKRFLNKRILPFLSNGVVYFLPPLDIGETELKSIRNLIKEVLDEE